MSPPPALTPGNPNMTPLAGDRFHDDTQFASAYLSHPLSQIPVAVTQHYLPPTLRPHSFQYPSARDTSRSSQDLTAFSFIMCQPHCSGL